MNSLTSTAVASRCARRDLERASQRHDQAFALLRIATAAARSRHGGGVAGAQLVLPIGVTSRRRWRRQRRSASTGRSTFTGTTALEPLRVRTSPSLST